MPATVSAGDLLTRPRGTLLLSPRATGLDLYLREDYRHASHYPTPCPGDIRLHSWERDGVLVVGLLICCAKKPLLTFQAWLNLNTAHDMQVLAALRGDGDLMLQIVTEQGRRSIRIPNVVRRDAVRIAGDMKNLKALWTPEQFEAACRSLDRDYPTASSLYRAVTT
jgi:hypothetical protein